MEEEDRGGVLPGPVKPATHSYISPHGNPEAFGAGTRQPGQFTPGMEEKPADFRFIEGLIAYLGKIDHEAIPSLDMSTYY
jgi:hypothetical protein